MYNIIVYYIKYTNVYRKKINKNVCICASYIKSLKRICSQYVKMCIINTVLKKICTLENKY